MSYKKFTPNFSVKDVKETVLFYQNILGFALNLLVPKGQNVVEYRIEDDKVYDCAMMTKDEVFVMFLEDDCMKQDNPYLKGVSQDAAVLFYIDVDNIDEIYESIKDTVEFLKPLEKTWYGMKEFYIKDCNGYTLVFGQKAEPA